MQHCTTSVRVVCCVSSPCRGSHLSPLYPLESQMVIIHVHCYTVICFKRHFIIAAKL